MITDHYTMLVKLNTVKDRKLLSSFKHPEMGYHACYVYFPQILFKLKLVDHSYIKYSGMIYDPTQVFVILTTSMGRSLQKKKKKKKKKKTVNSSGTCKLTNSW